MSFLVKKRVRDSPSPRFVNDGIQVSFVLEALRIDLVEVLGA
jgi:hypothetical protein